MLRLVFYFKDRLLKVRQAKEDEIFRAPKKWKAIEFELTDSPYMMMLWTSLLPDLPPKDALQILELVGARYPFSPEYPSLHQVCPEITFTNFSDEWVFFGGSFNPWHKGHQACLNLLAPEKTCFVLPDINPQKEIESFDPVTKTLELSSQIKFKKNQFLAPSFLFDKIKNPTVVWIERTKKLFPDQKLSLLMGHDSLTKISEWVRGPELLTLIDTIYVVARLEKDHLREATIKRLSQTARELKIEFLGRHDFEHLSSTDLRKKN